MASGSSLIQHFNETHRNGKRLWWGRADEDGYPFRGDAAPLMTEDEYEERVVRVADYRNGYFDTQDKDQNKLFCAVMECCYNGWFQLGFIDRFWRGTTKHYLEWVEYYKEDGSRTPFQNSRSMEVAPGGYANMPGYPSQG